MIEEYFVDANVTPETVDAKFYCTMIFILTGKIPDDIIIAWAPTVNDPEAPGGISATGEVIEFRTRRSVSQVITEMADIKKVWGEIKEMCEQEML